MNKYDKLIKAKMTEADALASIAETEDRVLSAEEITAINGLMDDVDTLKAENAEYKKTMSRLATKGPKASTMPSANIEVKEPRFTQDPMTGFKSAQEFLGAVAENGDIRPKSADDDRLKFLADASDAHNTQEGTFGGFRVPQAMVQGDPLRVEPEADPTKGRVREIPMEARTIGVRARVDKDHRQSVTGGLVVARRAEMEKAKASRQKTEFIAMTASSLDGLTYASDELLEDSPSTVSALLADFPQAFADKEFQEKLTGNGKGQFEGIFNNPAMLTVQSQQAGGKVVAKEIATMISRCYGASKGLFIANHDFLPELVELGENDKNIWHPDSKQGFSGYLFGLPIVFSEYLPSLGSKGDLILCNWSEYLVGSYGAQTQSESIHVRFEEGEKTFKFHKSNAGRSWWQSTLTPKNGSTKSPFVQLGARP